MLGRGSTYREQRDQIQSKEVDDGIQEVVQVPFDRPSKRLPGLSTRTTASESTPWHVESCPSRRACQLGGLLYRCGQSRWVRSLYGLNSRAILEDHEGRHSAHAILGCDVFLIVDVDLGERDALRLGEFGCKRLERRRNHFARTTPVGVDCTGATVSLRADELLGQRVHSQSATTMVDWRICRHSDEDPTCTAIMIVDFLGRRFHVEDQRWRGELRMHEDDRGCNLAECLRRRPGR